jgi:hypothetical protein
MKVQKLNASIVDGYVELLENLSSKHKLELISKLSNSVKLHLSEKRTSFKNSFGAFESKKTAEEIIEEIRNSRISNRKMVCFEKISD